jgi:hypothetical protein
MACALGLSSRLAAERIHGRLIFYRWHICDTAIGGSHVFVVFHLPDDSVWIVDNEIAHPRKAPKDASPMQLVFLLSDAGSDQVDVGMQDGLNHLSYF